MPKPAIIFHMESTCFLHSYILPTNFNIAHGYLPRLDQPNTVMNLQEQIVTEIEQLKINGIELKIDQPAIQEDDTNTSFQLATVTLTDTQDSSNPSKKLRIYLSKMKDATVAINFYSDIPFDDDICATNPGDNFDAFLKALLEIARVVHKETRADISFQASSELNPPENLVEIFKSLSNAAFSLVKKSLFEHLPFFKVTVDKDNVETITSAHPLAHDAVNDANEQGLRYNTPPRLSFRDIMEKLLHQPKNIQLATIR